jgi:DNA modification methylase
VREPALDSGGVTIFQGEVYDVLSELADKSVDCCITSPPYFGLRDYGEPQQIGVERLYTDYLMRLLIVFDEVRRVLKDDGTLWLNLGDSYATGAGLANSPGGGKEGATWHGTQANRLPQPGLKPKDLMMIPARVALALQANGWYVRSEIVWSKPNPRPESATDRPTTAHEKIFLLTKSEVYYYNAEAVKEPATKSGSPGHLRSGRGVRAGTREGLRGVQWRQEDGRNKRSVWTVPVQPFYDAHFAVMPVDLVRPCVLAGCPPGGIVLDPFAGSGTTLLIARELGCRGLGIEINPDSIAIARRRLAQDVFDWLA